MDTGGWDTVYAVDIDAVNASLAQGFAQIPQTFDISGTDFLPYVVQGQFAAWRVIPGGSGQLLWLQLDIASGSFTLGSGAQMQKASLAQVGIQVEVSLQLIPAQAGASVLKFNFHAVGKPGQSQPGLVTPLNKVLDPHKALSKAMTDALSGLMAEFLVQNAALVTYVFATINPTNKATAGWLEPVKSDYVYLQNNSGAAYLAILSVTSQRDIASLPRTVDTSLMATGVQGFFAISQDLFMQQVVQPLLPGVWGHGATAATFRYDARDHALLNQGNLGVDGVQKGAITYYPSVNAMRMVVNGGNLVSTVSGDCDLKMGMSMTFTITTTSLASYNTTTKTIAFAPDPNPQQTHDSDIPWYDYMMGAIPSLIIALVVPAIASGITTNLTAQLQQISVLGNAPQAVQWTGLGSTKVARGGLAGGFYLILDFH